MNYWEKNGIDKPQEIIVCAACKYETGIILCGPRHHNVNMQAHDLGIFTEVYVDGFLNQFAEFRTREESMKIVLENGQPFNSERNGGSGKELYSEGLY
jgi:hypothetical protein